MNPFRLPVLILSLTVCTAAQTFTNYTTKWAGQTRQYGVYLPTGLPSNPSMILYLHGTYQGPGTPYQAINQFEAEANTNKFVMVWPLATFVPKNNASYWAASDVTFTFYPNNPDDVHWLCNLIPALVKQFSVNSKAVFMTGMSSGAMMTQRVAMTCPGEVAAIAPVSGQIYMKHLTDSWAPPASIGTPVSVLEIHGDADTDLEYCGQVPHLQWGATYMNLPSVDVDMKFWTTVNKCAAPTVQLCTNGSPTPNVTGLTATGCSSGVEVQFIDNVGGGHIWPSWAYNTVVQFLLSHPR